MQICYPWFKFAFLLGILHIILMLFLCSFKIITLDLASLFNSIDSLKIDHYPETPRCFSQRSRLSGDQSSSTCLGALGNGTWDMAPSCLAEMLSCPSWVWTCHPPGSVFQRAEITEIHHHAWLGFHFDFRGVQVWGYNLMAEALISVSSDSVLT